MGLKAIVTLDLKDAGPKYKDEFYACIKENNWIKLAAKDTTWKLNFVDSSSRTDVASSVRNCLNNSKKETSFKHPMEAASTITYNIQMALENIDAGEI